MALLNEDEIRGRMDSLAKWKREGDHIERTFRFDSFPDAIGFVDRVAELAEQADHHPDIDIRYREVKLVLTTHSAGGLTSRDIALAERIDRLG